MTDDQVSRQAVLDVLEAATQRHSEKGDRAAVEEDSAKLSAAVYVVNVLLDAQAAVSALPSATTAGEGVLAEIPEDPWRAFAWFIGRCASGFGGELVRSEEHTSELQSLMR